MVPFVAPKSKTLLKKKGDNLIGENGEIYPIVNDIPRFVTDDNYVASFGLEWSIHRKVQQDSSTGFNIGRERLERCLGKPLENLNGLNVFEGGAGAGRFTELLVNSEANVHSIDMSIAVDTNKENIGERENYTIAQANLMEPPYKQETFDVVFCLGVIQHTPSPEKSIEVLYSLVKPGGRLVIDHYTWSISFVTKLAPLYRLVLKNMKPDKSKKITDGLVDFFFPIHWAVRKFFPAQALLSRISPCLFYYRKYPQLSKEQHYEFTKLDTYDHLTDYYKHLRTRNQIIKILKKLGAIDIEVWYDGNGVEARSIKPSE